MKSHIWWIRRDIRLQDNSALNAAQSNTDFLIPLFIIEPELMANAAPTRKAFLINALTDLDHQLKNLGSRLIIRIGPALSALRELADELGEIRIFAHEDFSHFALKRDEKVNANFNLFSLPGITIRHPTDILKTDGKPYTVFTPFKNKWYGAPLPVLENCLPVPRNLPPVPEGVQSENLPKTIQIPGFPATMQEGQNRLSRYCIG